VRTAPRASGRSRRTWLAPGLVGFARPCAPGRRG